jgi:hypothetical protein
MLILLRVGFSPTQMMDRFPSLAHTSFATIGIMRTGGGAATTFIQTLHQGILIGPFGPGISKYRPLIPIVV